jgi:hypothetical protein
VDCPCSYCQSRQGLSLLPRGSGSEYRVGWSRAPSWVIAKTTAPPPGWYPTISPNVSTSRSRRRR